MKLTILSESIPQAEERGSLGASGIRLPETASSEAAL